MAAMHVEVWKAGPAAGRSRHLFGPTKASPEPGAKAHAGLIEMLYVPGVQKPTQNVEAFGLRDSHWRRSTVPRPPASCHGRVGWTARLILTVDSLHSRGVGRESGQGDCNGRGGAWGAGCRWAGWLVDDGIGWRPAGFNVRRGGVERAAQDSKLRPSGWPEGCRCQILLYYSVLLKGRGALSASRSCRGGSTR